MGPSGMYGLPVTQYSRRPSKFVIIGIVLGALLLATIIASIVSGQIAGANRAPLERFSVRLTNLTTFITTNEGLLKSGDTAKASSETRVLAESASSELAPYLVKQPSKSVVTNETDTSSAQKLSDAVKTGTYDAEYRSILQSKLESVEAVMNETYSKASNATFKTALLRYYNDFSSISKQLQ